jgi:hypothetical protein
MEVKHSILILRKFLDISWTWRKTFFRIAGIGRDSNQQIHCYATHQTILCYQQKSRVPFELFNIMSPPQWRSVHGPSRTQRFRDFLFSVYSALPQRRSNKSWEAKAYVQTEPRTICRIIHLASGWWREGGENLPLSQRQAGVMLQHSYSLAPTG